MRLDSEVEAYEIVDNCTPDEEGDIMCSPTYYYTVEDKKYTCETNYSSSEKVSYDLNKVYYDSKNPNNCVNEYSSSISFIKIITFIFPIIFIVIGIVIIKKGNKKTKKLRYLSKHGTLIKKLPYTMKPTNVTYNGVKLYAINIVYTMPDGTVLNLEGEPRFDHLKEDFDGGADLLIDLNNPENYYIDFNIDPKY